MENWCEIFRTGCHKDSKGNERNWKKEDLEKIKYNFENVNPDVPICVGHPKTNAPAYGWWDKLKIEGNKLFAKFKQVQPEFMEACDKGLFKTRSISLTSDLVPRHLAFLGAQAPAIKGMEQFQFEESDSDIKINFVSQCEKGENNMDFEEENKNLKEQLKNLQQELKDKEEKEKLKEFSDFCDKAVENGNIFPCQREGVLSLFQSLEDKTFNFEDGSEKNSKDVLKDFISSLKQMNFNEIASKNNIETQDEINFNDPNEVKEAILKVQKEHQTKGIELSVLDAFKKIERK